MIRDILINVWRFVLLACLQLFILNNIQFSGFVNPYMYVLFVLWLPFETQGWLLLLSCFSMGLLIDIASGTVGYHTIATVFMGYLRYHLSRFIAPHDGYGQGMSPTASSLGLSWFMKYTLILVVAHHLVLFWVESFGLHDWLSATFRALCSSAFTILLILIYQFLTTRSR
jgi:rod shape-determining protein MreD